MGRDSALVPNGFELDIELACKLARNGHSPMEVPVNDVARGFAEGKKIRFGGWRGRKAHQGSHRRWRQSLAQATEGRSVAPPLSLRQCVR